MTNFVARSALVGVFVVLLGAGAWFALREQEPEAPAPSTAPAYTASFWHDESRWIGSARFAGVNQGALVWNTQERGLPALCLELDRRDHYLLFDLRSGKEIAEFRGGGDVRFSLWPTFDGLHCLHRIDHAGGEECLAEKLGARPSHVGRSSSTVPSASQSSGTATVIDGRSYELRFGALSSDEVLVRDAASQEVLFAERLAAIRASGRPDAHWGPQLASVAQRDQGFLVFWGDCIRILQFHPEIELREYRETEAWSSWGTEPMLDWVEADGTIRMLAERQTGTEHCFGEFRIHPLKGVEIEEFGLTDSLPDPEARVASHYRYLDGEIYWARSLPTDEGLRVEWKLPRVNRVSEVVIDKKAFRAGSNYGVKLALMPDFDGDSVDDFLMYLEVMYPTEEIAWWLISGATGEVLPRL